MSFCKCHLCFTRYDLVEVDLCYHCAIDIGWLKEPGEEE